MMPEYVLTFAARQIRRTFERAIGRNIAKILTELIANSDDSYRRLIDAGKLGGKTPEDPAPITIVFERSKKRFCVVDHAEGMSDEEMKDRFVSYGKESLDRSKGYRTRSLFGKGLRDVLFTQKNGQAKCIKEGLFYNCRFKWKDANGQDQPIVDIKAPTRVTPELRTALRIPDNGTSVEFILSEGVPNPQADRLVETISRFYMLRMINSSPHRDVTLIVVGSKGNVLSERQINYRFPKIDLMDRFQQSITSDLGTEIKIEGEIGITEKELSQGEAPNTEREGGLLVLDEDDAVLDLHLFGFDDDPAARRISGLMRLVGAGEYIRTKLNQAHPEEVLTETRDGFDRQHPFYRQLREHIHVRLAPLVAKLRELGPTPKVSLSDKTRERHKQALDILNQLASKMLGESARVPAVPATKLTPPIEGIAFANSHISIQTGLVTPAVLLINTSFVGAEDVISLASDNSQITVEPHSLVRSEDEREFGVAIKIVRIKSEAADLKGTIVANWKNVQSRLEVITTARNVLTPIDGLEFERDEYNVRLKARRNLRLYVDIEKIPVGSEIWITSEDAALRVSDSSVAVEAKYLVTDRVAQVDVSVMGLSKKRDIVVTASHSQYVAGTRVSVVKREKPDRGKHGLIRDYLFQPLETKVQTQWRPDGYVLINTKDPVNARYFGDDPGKAVEEMAHCQVRLADLILNECLQIMVSQALYSGKLEMRFPDNLDIDVRRYVDEQKFEIGPAVHEKFVTKI